MGGVKAPVRLKVSTPGLRCKSKRGPVASGRQKIQGKKQGGGGKCRDSEEVPLFIKHVGRWWDRGKAELMD